MKPRHLFGLAIALLVILSALPRPQPAAALNPLTISFIDVGEGDSILVRDSNGFDILIDGGDAAAGPVVASTLRSAGVDDIDVMVATHPDADHIGGLIPVLAMADIPVVQVLYSGYPGDTATWTSFVNAVANEGLSLTTAQYPANYTWGETSADILNPPAGLGSPETNAASIVVRLAYGSLDFLFTGDISSTEEAAILDHGSSVSANILKVAHHGSSYSSSASFLAAVGMQDAVISVGPNSYGHPAADTLARLFTAGARLWRTDQNGMILVSTDGSDYSITPARVVVTYAIYFPLVANAAAPSPPPPATSGNIAITAIFADGAGSSEPDEYVEIRNEDVQAIQVAGWTLRDTANHVFTFPAFVMLPNLTCRVYTNQAHPEWCGFDYSSASPIWNNTNDCAYLRDSSGLPIDDYCY